MIAKEKKQAIIAEFGRSELSLNTVEQQMILDLQRYR